MILRHRHFRIAALHRDLYRRQPRAGIRSSSPIGQSDYQRQARGCRKRRAHLRGLAVRALNFQTVRCYIIGMSRNFYDLRFVIGS